MHKPEDALTRASYNYYVVRKRQVGRAKGGKHTFSMNPKERICFLPAFENAPLKEPACRSLLMSTARDVMVRGRVRRGKPFMKVVP